MAGVNAAALIAHDHSHSLHLTLHLSLRYRPHLNQQFNHRAGPGITRGIAQQVRQGPAQQPRIDLGTGVTLHLYLHPSFLQCRFVKLSHFGRHLGQTGHGRAARTFAPVGV